MKRTIGNRGFTLIEIVTSIVVMTIIGVIAGMGFVEISRGYVMSKKNAEVTQKGQIALARLKKELTSINSNSITCGSANMITYEIKRDGSADTTTIYRAAGTNPSILIKTNSDCSDCAVQCSGGDTLVDNADTLTFSYCKTPTDCSTSYGAPNYTSATVTLIEVTLKLKGYDDATIRIADPDLVALNLGFGG